MTRRIKLQNSRGALSPELDFVEPMGHALAVDDLVKAFPGQTGLKPVLSDISFVVDEGEIVSLVGPSGCGKSTLLHILAGFDTDFQGCVMFAGQPIDGPSTERGMIFQIPQLFSWLSVEDNIGFGLKRAGVPKGERQIRVNEFLQGVGMEEYRSYYPGQLSGGMRQRTALARTLIMRPSLILLDEPFSALDYPARLEMQQLTLDLWSEYKPSLLFVTHDIEEAVLLADRVLVMSKDPGKISREVPVDISGPRDISLIKEASFHKLKNEILDDLVFVKNRV